MTWACPHRPYPQWWVRSCPHIRKRVKRSQTLWQRSFGSGVSCVRCFGSLEWLCKSSCISPSSWRRDDYWHVTFHFSSMWIPLKSTEEEHDPEKAQKLEEMIVILRKVSFSLIAWDKWILLTCLIDRVEIREEMRLGIQRLLSYGSSSSSRRHCLVNNQMILSLFKRLVMNNIRERLLDTTQSGLMFIYQHARNGWFIIINAHRHKVTALRRAHMVVIKFVTFTSAAVRWTLQNGETD